MLGLGLSPVMVGATEVIVGNAAVELAGVAGGSQSTAMQVGGALIALLTRQGHATEAPAVAR